MIDYSRIACSRMNRFAEKCRAWQRQGLFFGLKKASYRRFFLRWRGETGKNRVVPVDNSRKLLKAPCKSTPHFFLEYTAFFKNTTTKKEISPAKKQKHPTFGGGEQSLLLHFFSRIFQKRGVVFPCLSMAYAHFHVILIPYISDCPPPPGDWS